jgi:nucleotide-binding universal stress UspA family protein
VKTILCPTDFSDASRHAIDHAIALALWYRARIAALHVYTPIFMPVPGLPPPEARVPDGELDRVRAETAQCFSPATAAGIEVHILIDVGRPAPQILDRAEALPADLIVMGTHGAGGFEHLLLGSVTEKVLRRAACPVLTVPPGAQATSALPYRRVLCAVDFSDPSLRALELACSIAGQSGATLTSVHVIEWPWHEPPAPGPGALPPAQADALAEFRRYLETTARNRLEALVPESMCRCPAGSIVAHGRPYVELLRIAGEIKTDLIVIGVHGRNVAGLTLFGSTTNQVVRRATCPVLTLRYEGAAGRR